MFVITGATGNTDSVIAEKLLARKEPVRVIGRDAGRLARFVQLGAEAFVADVTDAAALRKAFDGASAVYAMVPTDISSTDPRGYQERVSDALTRALSQARVTHAVVLSSLGADKPAGTGPVVGLHNLEQKITAVAGLNAIYLRPTYFMENFLEQVEVIKNFGIIGGEFRADLRMPMIATRDIGAAAAEVLQKRDFQGKQARELLGRRDLTCQEVASVIGAAIGKPDLAYVRMPPDQMKSAMIQVGISAEVADLLLELGEALNSGYIVSLEGRSSQNTTPTSIEVFVAEEFLPRFQGKAARG